MRWLNRKRGASVMGYALLLGLISVFSISSITLMGDETTGIFETAGETVGLGSAPAAASGQSPAAAPSASSSPANLVPLVTPPGNRSVTAGQSIGPLAFGVNDPDGDAGSVIVTATSGDQALVTDGSIVLGGSGSSRTISLDTVSGQSGVATITIQASDAQDTASASFDVTLEFDSSPDFTPPSFASGQFGVAESGTASVMGFDGTLAISISGTGSPQVSVNGGGWTTSANVSAGDSVQLRFADADQVSTSYAATLAIGAASYNISYSTSSNPCPSGSSLLGDGKGCVWASAGTYNFTFSSGFSTLYVKMWGAGGGSTNGTYGAAQGGGGGFSTATVSYAGESLQVIVGGGGTAGGGADAAAHLYGRGGHGGGADGGIHSLQKLRGHGAGGGGRSALRRGGTEIVTAGGGGGAYPYTNLHGGAGGGSTGQDGIDGGSYGAGGGGHGGSQSSGGTGGLDSAPCGGGNGSQYNGGLGGSGPGSGSNNSYGAPGGGGGWYGGGGGSAHGSCGFRWGGAGGGSGRVSGSGVSGSTSTGNRQTPAGTGDSDYVSGTGTGGYAGNGGNGRVIIRWAN